MKKLIAGFMTALIALLIVTSPVLAVPPQSISGRIYTTPAGAADSLTVRAINIRTEMEMVAERGSNQYLFEIYNMPGGYVLGDTIRLRVDECQDNPSCTQDVIVQGSPLYIDFDLTDKVCLECPGCPAQPSCPTTTTTVCPDCLEGIDPELLIVGGVISFAAILIFLFGTKKGKETLTRVMGGMVKAGWGVRIYRGRDGTLKIYHKNPGIVSYHSPDTVHRNESIRHDSGVIFG